MRCILDYLSYMMMETTLRLKSNFCQPRINRYLCKTSYCSTELTTVFKPQDCDPCVAPREFK